MRSNLAVAFIAIGVLTWSAVNAAQRQVQCKLVVNGKTYINGPCNFEADPDGSFRIGVLRDDQKIPAKGFYFAYVNVSGNTAQAKWNEDPKALHADVPLGTLTRNGACWESETVQICAR